MPADYISRLPGTKETIASISAFDLFQANFFDLQMQDEHLQMLQTFMTKNEWPDHLSKQDRNYFQSLADKAFQDKNKVVWVRLTNFNYPWTALYLPIARKPCVRLMTALSVVTMPLKNIRENFHFLVLAQDDSRHQETQELLPLMPTMEKVNKQEDSTGTSTNF